MADLVFQDPPAGSPPIDLVFGGTIAPPTGTTIITADAALPGLEAEGVVRIAVIVSSDAELPPLESEGVAIYATNTARPVVGQVSNGWQKAIRFEVGPSLAWNRASQLATTASNGWQDAAPLRVSKDGAWANAVGQRQSRSNRWQDGVGVRQSRDTTWQDGVRQRQSRESGWQDGAPQRRSASFRWQQGSQTRNSAAASWQAGVVVSRSTTGRFAKGVPAAKPWDARWQDGVPPPPGEHPTVTPPVDTPCYTPPAGNAVDLVFSEVWTRITDLVFVCETHVTPPDGGTVVVPVKDVYIVVNSSTLTNVATGQVIPTTGASMSLDVDSWTWTLNVSVPGYAMPLVEPVDGEPVEVDLLVNGAHYRFFIEGISRDRTFGKSALTLTGRGKTASLDAPYAPTMTFTNTSARTAQQLIADILTDNGVPMDWDVTWNPVDWTVPANVFSFTGTYIGAINTVAAAAGAYVQPHPTDQALSVLLRYPVVPSLWPTTTPDFELPADVAQRESISWENKAAYNKVYVSGQQQGVSVGVTVDGTDGSLPADNITDALITTVAAAQQRAIPVLANTGRIATVGLRLPVLPATGIIPPGKLVKYVDGGVTRYGLTRGVSVEIGNPAIWQTISLEVHE